MLKQIRKHPRVQRGFTLIELMIAVAIVGILAAIAIPAFQDYMNRSKMSEVMATLAACKTSVTEYQASNQAFPTIAQSGCNITATKYVSAINVTAATGVISATVQNVANGVNGQVVRLHPMLDTTTNTLATANDSIARWSCTTNAAAANYKYLPSNCRKANPGITN